MAVNRWTTWGWSVRIGLTIAIVLTVVELIFGLIALIAP